MQYLLRFSLTYGIAFGLLSTSTAPPLRHLRMDAVIPVPSPAMGSPIRLITGPLLLLAHPPMQ